MYTISLILLAVSGYCSAKAISGGENELLKIRLSPSAQEISPGELLIPFKDCGYIFCEAPDVTTDAETHLWDYHVDWELPPMAEKDPKVFVLANDFQMPRSYLVYQAFNPNFTGQYKCILNFRSKPIASTTFNIKVDEDTVSTKNCISNTP
ncbi:uncharacterized protein [Macrobrachium rosenbergii]|uniref:uncharacterized protein n=1 Tax=Macrobrachium rosenbergii TaxID=79674 RepID=UPI0034D4600E